MNENSSSQTQAERLALKAQGLKLCTLCRVVKTASLEFFHKNKRGYYTGYCRECQAARQIEYRIKNPQKVKDSARQYRKNNPEKVKQDMREWQEKRNADPVKYAAELERARLKNQRSVLEGKSKLYVRAYRARNEHNPEYWERIRASDKKRYTRDREKRIAMSANGRARRAAAPGEWTGKDLNRLFAAQNGCCFYCGCKVGVMQKWHVDHFIPLSKGGSNDPENLVIACQPCNNRKWNKMPHEFMPERFVAPEQ